MNTACAILFVLFWVACVTAVGLMILASFAEIVSTEIRKMLSGRRREETVSELTR